MKNSPETLEQSALIDWVELMKHQVPALDLLFHIPNEGKRSPRSGAEQKRMGLKRGVPDLFLPVPSGERNGLFIEMKAGNNKPTKSQEDCLNRLADQGYCCVVCWSWEAAAFCICKYLNLSCKPFNGKKIKWVRYKGGSND